MGETTVQALIDHVIEQSITCGNVFTIETHGFEYQVRSNTSCIKNWLNTYYENCGVTKPFQEKKLASKGQNAKSIYIVELSASELSKLTNQQDIVWRKWNRDSIEAKSAVTKEWFYDLPEGRIIKKAHTELCFIQTDKHVIAFGECLNNIHQLITFINQQYINEFIRAQWLMFHGAVVGIGQMGVAFFSHQGHGKTTEILSLLSNPKVKFLSNDRFLGRVLNGQLSAKSIAKLPRVNPGSILQLPELHSILPENEFHALFEYSKNDLWHLEDKHDVFIDRIYGENKIISDQSIDYIFFLNWDPQSNQPLEVNKISISDRPDLLPSMIKPRGPLFSDEQHQFDQKDDYQSRKDYENALDSCGNVFEVTGEVDFETLTEICLELASAHEYSITTVAS